MLYGYHCCELGMKKLMGFGNGCMLAVLDATAQCKMPYIDQYFELCIVVSFDGHIIAH